jgi:hypothetical protein
MLNYTQENIKHIPLRIEYYREAVPINLLKWKSTNDKHTASKHLKIPDEPKSGPCPIYLITID